MSHNLRDFRTDIENKLYIRFILGPRGIVCLSVRCWFILVYSLTLVVFIMAVLITFAIAVLKNIQSLNKNCEPNKFRIVKLWFLWSYALGLLCVLVDS